MDKSRQTILLTPLILLALADLTMLAIRLWPWPQITSLPGNGTTGVDPAVALLGYIGVAWWIGSAGDISSRKSLFSAAWLGVIAGLFLVAQVTVAARQPTPDAANGPDRVQIALLALALLLLAIAGGRAARAGHTIGFSTVCAIWASLLACLMAVAAVLCQSWLGAGAAESIDPWKDYQGLAIGTPAMQALVHSLDTVSAFLLIGPIAGGVAGALLASLGRPKKA